MAWRCDDRFITILQALKGLQRRGLLEVSIVTRFPVIGSRMVMGSPLPFRQTENAALTDSIIFD